MKKSMKIVAVVLLVAGLGLVGTGAYVSYFIEAQRNCPQYLARWRDREVAALAAAGTPKAAALKQEASDAQVGAEMVCDSAKRNKQNGMMMMLGGLLSIIASVGLLVFSRRAGR